MVDILAISDDGHNDDDVIPARLAPVDCRLLRGEKSPKLPEKYEKITGGTPEVRSDKSLTFVTFNIRHSTYGPMDQRTNGPMD